MKAEDIIDAVGQADDRFILETMAKKKGGFSSRRAVKTLLIAAVVASLLTATAYASDFLGFRAMLTSEKLEFNGETYDQISLTQPQEAPPELADEKTQKIQNSESAWAEWDAYITELHESKRPAILKYMDSLDGATMWEGTELEDGSVEYSFYTPRDPDTDERTLIASKVFTAEEQAEYDEYWDQLDASYTNAGQYDFNYQAYGEDEVKALEELAAKYGLKLRGNSKLAWSSDTTGRTGEGFYTNAELAAMTADFGNSGSVFYEPPVGFDKVYWFDEGTFCVSFYVDLPSTGEQVTCYGYNSMYATLSSGNEVRDMMKDTSSFTTRTHTAPDGTELTVMSDGTDAYFYVFLDNSYFAAHIGVSEQGMTDADVDSIIDSINYSVIGQGEIAQ